MAQFDKILVVGDHGRHDFKNASCSEVGWFARRLIVWEWEGPKYANLKRIATFETWDYYMEIGRQ